MAQMTKFSCFTEGDRNQTVNSEKGSEFNGLLDINAVYENGSILLSLTHLGIKNNQPSLSLLETEPLIKFDEEGRKVFQEGMTLLKKAAKEDINLGKGIFEKFTNVMGMIVQQENPYAYETLFTRSVDCEEYSYGVLGDSVIESIYSETFSRRSNKAGLRKDLFFFMKNLLNLDGDALEKLIKSLGTKFLITNIAREEILFENNNKLNRSLGIPKELLNKINNGYNTCLNSFQRICSICDGNDAIYLVNFLDKWYSRADENLKCFVVNAIADILEHKKRSMPSLITYLVRQGYYSDEHTGSIISLKDLKTACIWLKDSFEIYKEIFGFEMKEYPIDLEYEHFVLTKNFQETLSTSDRVEFEEAVTAYGSELSFEDKHFLIRAPRTPEEVVYEGTFLRHCVSKYNKSIAHGQSIVLFLRRKNDPETPFVTIEYDYNYGIVQLKTFCDKDMLDKEVLDFAHLYEDELQKRKDGKKTV